MPTAEIVRGVHSAHDVIIDRPIGVGATVTIRAVVVGVDRRVAGATQRVRFEAVDAAGQTLWRTMLTSVFIGVELAGEPSSIDVDWPSVPARTAASGVTIDERHSVGAGDLCGFLGSRHAADIRPSFAQQFHEGPCGAARAGSECRGET